MFTIAPSLLLNFLAYILILFSILCLSLANGCFLPGLQQKSCTNFSYLSLSLSLPCVIHVPPIASSDLANYDHLTRCSPTSCHFFSRMSTCSLQHTVLEQNHSEQFCCLWMKYVNVTINEYGNKSHVRQNCISINANKTLCIINVMHYWGEGTWKTMAYGAVMALLVTVLVERMAQVGLQVMVVVVEVLFLWWWSLWLWWPTLCNTATAVHTQQQTAHTAYLMGSAALQHAWNETRRGIRYSCYLWRNRWPRCLRLLSTSASLNLGCVSNDGRAEGWVLIHATKSNTVLRPHPTVSYWCFTMWCIPLLKQWPQRESSY